MNTSVNFDAERFYAAKRSCFDRLYENLNAKQREAIFTVNGPLLVLAGAGSGKTTVLVNRIAHIMRYGNAYHSTKLPDGVSNEETELLELMSSGNAPIDAESLKRYSDGACPPWSILSITFTNKAADSMKKKLCAILGDEASSICAGTFHSVCARILRRDIHRLGYDNSFGIYDTDDSKRLLKACYTELEIPDSKFPLKPVLNIISRAKEKLLSPADFSAEAGNDFYLGTVAKLFTLYQKKLVEASSVDFDDLIGLTVRLFSENPDVLDFYRRKFRYILVDEYQDTNKSQFMLISMLAGEYHNIMVVGDDDQSIYSFRGATVENILGFDKSFVDAKVIKLEQNYRSTSAILNAANSVIAKNNGRYGKQLWCDSASGEIPKVVCVDTQNDEAQYSADIISDAVSAGAKFSDFAVLFRVNAQAGVYETMFAKNAIPYRVLCGLRFYERAEIKDILSYLYVMQNEKDNVRLIRACSTPKRGIGATTVDAAAAIADAENTTLYSVFKNAGAYEALSRTAPRLCSFIDLIEHLRAITSGMTISETVDTVFTESGYKAMLEAQGDAEADRIENVKTLVSNAAIHAEGNPDATLSSFLEEISLIADIDNYDNDANAVTMMTVHSAKGLEFPNVIIPGMEEGIFPNSLAESPSEIEEERRLAYVAFTRAEKTLTIIHTHERMIYGHTKLNMPSRFIGEIGEQYIKREDASMSRFKRSVKICDKGDHDIPYAPAKSVAPSSPVTAKKIAAPISKEPVEIFKSGDSVLHRVFGKGLVITASPMGNDMLYEVMFDSAGTKKLLGNFAKLKHSD